MAEASKAHRRGEPSPWTRTGLESVYLFPSVTSSCRLKEMSKVSLTWMGLFIFSLKASAMPMPAGDRTPLIATPALSQGLHKSNLIFDLPLSYNKRVSYWITYYQTRGKPWFKDWLQLSTKYLPAIQHDLHEYGLPKDLAFMVMIESGFKPNAKSTASAVGPWQFMELTAARYGLRINYWLDERRDFKKSTIAAIKYLRDLHQEFGSWYLVAASYNMGETNLRRQIHKFKTNDYWALARVGALPAETMDYVPKILAAMMIAKAPGLYGFEDITELAPLEYETVEVPGGTLLQSIADHIGVTEKSLQDLNSELLINAVPPEVTKHTIRVPRGAVAMVTRFVNGSRTQ